MKNLVVAAKFPNVMQRWFMSSVAQIIKNGAILEYFITKNRVLIIRKRLMPLFYQSELIMNSDVFCRKFRLAEPSVVFGRKGDCLLVLS